IAVPGADGDNVTVAANPHLRLIFGYAAAVPEEAITPFAPERFIEPETRAEFLVRLSTDGAVTDYLLRMRRIDGSPVWVEITARARASRRGGALRIEALVRDVSERKKLDDRSRDIYQQILQSEKMAALGQPISGVEHALKHPPALRLGG